MRGILVFGQISCGVVLVVGDRFRHVFDGGGYAVGTGARKTKEEPQVMVDGRAQGDCRRELAMKRVGAFEGGHVFVRQEGIERRIPAARPLREKWTAVVSSCDNFARRASM